MVLLFLVILSSLPSSISPGKHKYILHLYNFIILRMVYKVDHIICDIMSLAFFTKNKALEIQPSCWVSVVHTFYCRITFCSMDLSHFAYPYVN